MRVQFATASCALCRRLLQAQLSAEGEDLVKALSEVAVAWDQRWFCNEDHRDAFRACLATTPCTHCQQAIEVLVSDPVLLERALKAAGAIWDRGWFCGTECRDAFNAYGPDSFWDRARTSLKPKPEA